MSRKHIALTTKEDLFEFFDSMDIPAEESNGSVVIEDDFFHIKLTPENQIYHVKIINTEDSGDTEELNTDDPVKFIVEFLKTGTEGDEFFNKMSSSPSSVSKILKILASKLENNKFSKPEFSRILRRVTAGIFTNRVRVAFQSKDLEVQLKQKGWKTHQEGDKIIVDIGEGLFEAHIKIQNIVWSYDFLEKQNPEDAESGFSDEPIAELRVFLSDPELWANQR